MKKKLSDDQQYALDVLDRFIESNKKATLENIKDNFYMQEWMRQLQSGKSIALGKIRTPKRVVLTFEDEFGEERVILLGVFS